MSHAISVTNHPALAPENVTLKREMISTRAMAMMGVGAVCGVVAIIMGTAMGMQKQAIMGYLVGTMICMGLSLGGLFWTLVFMMFDSGVACTPCTAAECAIKPINFPFPPKNSANG